MMTSLIADTIGGNARSLMIVCISPSDFDKEATLDTLHFAQETGKIKNHYGGLTTQQDGVQSFNDLLNYEPPEAEGIDDFLYGN
jgi:hypothetical protein